MRIKTSELQRTQLDWAVAQALHLNITKVAGVVYVNRNVFLPSVYWEQGGPIIEREKITVVFRIMRDGSTNYWATTEPNDLRTDYEPVGLDGPTPLIAAMRCYVASKLGDTIEIPEGLV